MLTLEKLASMENVKEEYRKAFLLNLFQKICVRMNRNPTLHDNVLTLFRQTHNECETIRAIIKRELSYDLSTEEAEIMQPWFFANLKKNKIRKPISTETKQALCESQNWECAICGEKLGNDLSKIHVDHIIPFVLVGDELENNYQALCPFCNSCKSAHTDYIFKKLLKII